MQIPSFEKIYQLLLNTTERVNDLTERVNDLEARLAKKKKAKKKK